MKSLAVEKTKEIQRENSLSHENVLVKTLLSMVNEDKYYKLSEIKGKMVEHLEHGDWVNEKYVGKILRRLGLSTKRRIATGYEYFLKVSEVKEWCKRLEISEGSELSEHTGEEGNQNTSG